MLTNANLRYVGPFENVYVCKKTLFFLICMSDILGNFQKAIYFFLSTFEFLFPSIAQNLLDHVIVDLRLPQTFKMFYDVITFG